MKERKENDEKYTTRYIGSMVSDIHRNLFQGGVFLYPPNKKMPTGKLRLLYECNPIAFIVEQAGGKAISMGERIMEIESKDLHQRSSFFLWEQRNDSSAGGAPQKGLNSRFFKSAQNVYIFIKIDNNVQ